MNFGNIEAFVREEDWSRLADYMEKHVDQLIRGGAEVILCVSNTLHKPLEIIMEEKEVPFIHIADPTGKEINKKGLSRMILLGTIPVLQLSCLKERYKNLFGLEILVPSLNEQKEIDRIIFDELVKFDIRESSRNKLVEIIGRLARENGAEGVILGCTELFLLLNQGDISNLPVFDTTMLHCRAGADFALSSQ